MDTISFLKREIAELEGRLEPHDTGHIRTAINVLRARLAEEEQGAKDPLLLGHWDHYSDLPAPSAYM
jgi:hypothetical protein